MGGLGRGWENCKLSALKINAESAKQSAKLRNKNGDCTHRRVMAAGSGGIQARQAVIWYI